MYLTWALVFMCKDPAFAKILDTLRVRKPKRALLNQICRHHKAWSTPEPTVQDMKKLFEATPDTDILTCRKRGERVANDVALRAIFGNRKPLTVLAGDVEQNAENYDAEGNFRQDRVPKVSSVPIYKKMKIVLTQNLRKEDDYVNGMQCTVETFEDNAEGGVLRVRTRTGERLPITKWTNVREGGVRYFPIRIGYASTIHKAQGGEYKHVTIWMDAKHMPAAGYTALSRVAKSTDYKLGGKIKREHFVPATYVHPAMYKG